MVFLLFCLFGAPLLIVETSTRKCYGEFDERKKRYVAPELHSQLDSYMHPLSYLPGIIPGHGHLPFYYPYCYPPVMPMLPNFGRRKRLNSTSDFYRRRRRPSSFSEDSDDDYQEERRKPRKVRRESYDYPDEEVRGRRIRKIKRKKIESCEETSDDDTNVTIHQPSCNKRIYNEQAKNDTDQNKLKEFEKRIFEGLESALKKRFGEPKNAIKIRQDELDSMKNEIDDKFSNLNSSSNKRKCFKKY